MVLGDVIKSCKTCKAYNRDTCIGNKKEVCKSYRQHYNHTQKVSRDCWPTAMATSVRAGIASTYVSHDHSPRR
jgi:hypothetical protein